MSSEDSTSNVVFIFKEYKGHSILKKSCNSSSLKDIPVKFNDFVNVLEKDSTKSIISIQEENVTKKKLLPRSVIRRKKAQEKCDSLYSPPLSLPPQLFEELLNSDDSFETLKDSMHSDVKFDFSKVQSNEIDSIGDNIIKEGILVKSKYERNVKLYQNRLFYSNKDNTEGYAISLTKDVSVIHKLPFLIEIYLPDNKILSFKSSSALSTIAWTNAIALQINKSASIHIRNTDYKNNNNVEILNTSKKKRKKKRKKEKIESLELVQILEKEEIVTKIDPIPCEIIIKDEKPNKSKKNVKSPETKNENNSKTRKNEKKSHAKRKKRRSSSQESANYIKKRVSRSRSAEPANGRISQKNQDASIVFSCSSLEEDWDMPSNTKNTRVVISSEKKKSKKKKQKLSNSPDDDDDTITNVKTVSPKKERGKLDTTPQKKIKRKYRGKSPRSKYYSDPFANTNPLSNMKDYIIQPIDAKNSYVPKNSHVPKKVTKHVSD